MSELTTDSVKRVFLYSLIVSVAMAALFGIFAVMTGSFSWLNVRILLTTATIAAASLCGLSCGAYRATRRDAVLPLAGIGLTLFAALMVLATIWFEVESIPFLKWTTIASVYAVACAHLSLLSMAKLAPRFQPAMQLARGIIFAVATMISSLLLFEMEQAWLFRWLAVGAIVDTAVTIVIPILHRLSRGEMSNGDPPAGRLAAIDAELVTLRRRIDELERQRAQLA